MAPKDTWNCIYVLANQLVIYLFVMYKTQDLSNHTNNYINF